MDTDEPPVKKKKVDFLTTLSKNKKTIHNTYIFLCIIGNIWQAYLVCASYFSYDIVTTIDIAFPSDFTPPTMTLCFYVVNMIIWDTAKTKWPNLKDKMGMSNYSDAEMIKMLRDFTYVDKLKRGSSYVNDVVVSDFFEYTYKPDDIFETCSYVRPENYTIVDKLCKDIFNITTYFKEAFKCYAMTLKETGTYSYPTVQRIKGTNGYMYNMLLRANVTNITNDIFIYYTPRNTFPSEGFTRSLYSNDIKRLFSLTFQEYKNQLLEAPYDTDCRNYNASGYGDRGECWEACVQSDSLSRFGKIAAGTNVYKGLAGTNGQQLMSIAAIASDPDLTKALAEIEAKCDRACDKPNCRDAYFVPTLISGTNFSQPSLLTYVAQWPTINAKADPKIDFISFVTDLISTLGFWVGMDMLNMFDFFWKIGIDRTLEKRKEKKKQRLIRRGKIVEGGEDEEIIGEDVKNDVEDLKESMKKVQNALLEIGLPASETTKGLDAVYQPPYWHASMRNPRIKPYSGKL